MTHRTYSPNLPDADAPARYEQDGHVLTYTPRPSTAVEGRTVYDVSLNGVRITAGFLSSGGARILFAKLVTGLKVKAGK